MPELPEVETVKRTLENCIIGKTIKSIDVYRAKTLLNDEREFTQALIGQTFVSMSRIGKFLIFHTTNDLVIVSHLRMEGKFFLKDSNSPVLKHDLVCFNFTDGTSLRYNDTRRFGILGLRTKKDYLVTEPINKVGPDPFMMKDETRLVEAYKNRKTMIKPTLLDQSIMSGLGNIYCDEVLFETGIHPETLACDITPKQCKDIFEASKRILSMAIEKGGSTIHSYQSAEGINGEFQVNLHAYGNEGKLCPRCQKEVFKKKFVGGRGTTYCPNCQRNVSLPTVIGVTGPVGVGKSTVAKLLSKDKYPIIDADEIVHDLYKSSTVSAEISSLLRSKDILDSNEIIERKLLREYLLNHPEKKNKLETFVWEKVEENILHILSKIKKDDVVILDVPLLYEAKLNYICKKVVLVTADEKTQIAHLTKRGAATDNLLKINENYHLDEKIKLADYVIVNDGTLQSLKKRVSEVANSLKI